MKTIEEYLTLEDTLDYRSDFDDGAILPMEAATPTHALLESRLGKVLAAFSPCAVYGSSLNVYIASTNRILHPDATVVCGPASYPKTN